jgi:hypothetical protein
MADNLYLSKTQETTTSKVFKLDPAKQEELMKAITENLAQSAGRGSHGSVMQTLLSRHDRFGNSAIQTNAEMVGLTFVTKPRLNMTTESVRQDPTLAMLDTLDPLSLMFALRCNLDTVFSRRPDIADIAQFSPWFNDQSPFNVPLSNLLVGMSGWPDFSVEYESTETGYFSESMTLARGSDWGRRNYDLSLTFRDLQGGFLMAYFYYWLAAMALQMDGSIVAYPDDRDANRLNYTVSIYRFVMDPSMRTITKWAKATGCYPVSIPIGDVFNFGPGDSQIHTSQQFTIPFKANHIRYMDPRQLKQFNDLVKRYAGEEVGDIGQRVKTPVSAETNFKGLPWIDLQSGTNELMYLAEPEELEDSSANNIAQIVASIQAQMQAISTSG